MKHALITGIAAVAFSVASMAAMAADTTLTISSWAPPTHGVNAIIWPELTKRKVRDSSPCVGTI